MIALHLANVSFVAYSLLLLNSRNRLLSSTFTPRHYHPCQLLRPTSPAPLGVPVVGGRACVQSCSSSNTLMFSQVSWVAVWAASRVGVLLQHLFPRFLIPLVSSISQTWNSFRFMCRYYQWQKVVTAANMAFRSEIFESRVSL